MLFKTRVGMCILSENIEVRAFKADLAELWWIAAQYRTGGEGQARGLFGKVGFGGSWFYLAGFSDHPGVQAEISKAMQLITSAFESSARVCDLSGVGSADAWGKNWAQIQWS
ncbi:MAG TPA: hypothetical protein VGC55_06890 [Dokdonella sp.]